MFVLVACEESQEVTKAFRAKGHVAFSCDLQPCSGGHPEWHIITISSNSPKSFADQSRQRSKTFPGVALAMAEQWGSCDL